MKTLSLLRLYLLLVAFGFCAISRAETMQIEKIELQSIPARNVIPLIKPFLAENATISAKDYTIIVKTTAENMRQVKKLILDIDIPTKQLHISVSLDPWVMLQSQITNKRQQAPQAEKTAGENKSATSSTANADTTVIYKTTGHEVDPGIQIIKVLQNRWSMVRTGQSIPIKKRTRNPDGTITESLSYQQINQGLRIKPHLEGQQVTLNVQPFYEADNQTGPGKKLYYKQEKVATAMLGKWFGLEVTSGAPMPVDINWIKKNQIVAKPIPLIYLKVDLAP
jgi:hypothetical protein